MTNGREEQSDSADGVEPCKSRLELYEDSEDDGPSVEVESADWDLKAIGQVTHEGEEQYQIDQSGVAWVEVDSAESLDPPATFPADPPRPRHEETTLGRY